MDILKSWGTLAIVFVLSLLAVFILTWKFTKDSTGLRVNAEWEKKLASKPDSSRVDFSAAVIDSAKAVISYERTHHKQVQDSTIRFYESLLADLKRPVGPDNSYAELPIATVDNTIPYTATITTPDTTYKIPTSGFVHQEFHFSDLSFRKFSFKPEPFLIPTQKKYILVPTTVIKDWWTVPLVAVSSATTGYFVAKGKPIHALIGLGATIAAINITF